MEILQSLFRWIHVVAGTLWIGHLYFFNWVNANFAATMDGETKKKVVPELMPRALYFFRWGAAWTWITGLLLLLLVYYHGGIMFNPIGAWGPRAIVALVLVFPGVYIYEILVKTILKNPKVTFWGGWILASLVVYFFADIAHLSYRSYAIHLGAMFGSFMAFNVWYRIWPAQRKIIAAVKAGQAPDAAVVALAGTRSKHNTYMSVPLVFAMVSQHATWAAKPGYVSAVILVGWAVTFWIYGKAKTVKGF
jgi:uncharacterized membrane protein